MITMSKVGGSAALAGVLLLTAAAYAVTDAQKCEAAKNKIAGKYAFCRQKAEAKAIKTGDPVDYSKCDANFGLKWPIAEANGGGQCPTNGDQATQQAELTTNANRTTWRLSGGPRFVDNADGTITDHDTGLMWEKKDSGVDVVPDPLNLHDADNAYPWAGKCDDTTNELCQGDSECIGGHCSIVDNQSTGLTVFAFVAHLNGIAFGGHTDWRVPNIAELHGLLDYTRSGPAIDPAFYSNCMPGCGLANCSCTASADHWSSTTLAGNSSNAHQFNFGLGDSQRPHKWNLARVRAVRGGS